jgi:hypothetical protein
MAKVRKPTAPDASMPDGKSNLDHAWAKIENGLQRETEGKKLWIEGTLELVGILDEARKRLGSDQEFGTWLADSGYGEERITRHERAALLNMALNLDVTREVLEQTTRRSWRLIWEEEIQLRLPNGGQPPDPSEPKAPNGSEAPDGEELKAPTRRPRTRRAHGSAINNEQWSGDLNRFLKDALVIARNAIALKRPVLESTPETLRELQEQASTLLLEQLDEASEALAYVRARLDGSLEEKAEQLIQKGRVRTTPTRRASVPNQPVA